MFKIVLNLILISSVVISISACSRGGDDAPSNNQNANGSANDLSVKQSEYPNVAGSHLGQWETQGGGLKLFISRNKVLIAVSCENNKNLSIEVAVTVSNNKITINESKKVGDDKCNIQLEKNDSFQFTVSGNTLTLRSKNGEQNDLVRIEAPINSAPSKDTNDNSSTTKDLVVELFSQNNCGGSKTIYKAKMNCNNLSTSEDIFSISSENKCQNLERALSARSICEAINSQIK